jgi:hypothetical protein
MLQDEFLSTAKTYSEGKNKIDNNDIYPREYIRNTSSIFIDRVIVVKTIINYLII